VEDLEDGETAYNILISSINSIRRGNEGHINHTADKSCSRSVTAGIMPDLWVTTISQTRTWSSIIGDSSIPDAI